MNLVQNKMMIPIEGKPGWFAGRAAETLYRRYDDRELYYRVDEQGNPLPPDNLDYAAETEEDLITISCDTDASTQMFPLPRRYRRENEELEEILNHPDGIDWV